MSLESLHFISDKQGVLKYILEAQLSNANLALLICIIGLIFIISQLIRFIIYLLHQYRPQSSEFWKSYCLDDSWVIVTGAAEGAGRAFAEYFAKSNCNLVLFDIQENQLIQTAKAIKEKWNIQIKTKVIDFSKSNEEDFFFKIQEDLRGLDLAVIINNVGVLKMSKFEEISADFLQKEIYVNCCAGIGLTLSFLPALLQRKKRSAVINMSSWQADIAWPFVGPYSATKALVNSVSKDFGNEFSNKIDFLSLKPFGIRSRMSGNFKMPFMEEPEIYVKKSLKLLGRRGSSYGNLSQCFISILLQAILPGFILKKFASLSILALEKVKKTI